MRFKQVLTWIIIVCVGLLPVFFLFVFGPRDYSSVSHILGQSMGLIGMTLFSLTFLFSTRAKWIEDLFDGLDKVYPVHSILGAASLILILLHPIFLVMKFIPENIQLAAKYMLPGGMISVDFGIFALMGMIILLVITIYSNMKYHRWKFSHEFLGLFFILAILHVFFVRDSVARDYIFKGYYIYAAIVSFIGISAFFYSIMRTKILGKKYIIKEIKNISQCFEIILVPVNKNIKFKAGQFIFVKFLNGKIGKESHPFSIASPSDSPEIRIIAKNLGDYTSKLGELNKGDYAIVEGPYGRFHRDGFSEEVWIAGGIGITPFLGLAHDFKNKGRGHVVLYYTVKTKDEFIGLEEFQEIAKQNKHFKVIPWVSSEKGYLTVNEIYNLDSFKHKEYYLCGPEALKVSIKKGLIDKEIPKEKIHDERFNFK